MTFLYIFLAWIISLCIHEYAHARVAYAGGDTSVQEKGYLSLNPFHYVHPLYSIILPLIILTIGGIGLPGGAVYIETSRLRSKLWKSAVSAAGPLSNLILAIAIALVFRFVPVNDTIIWPALAFLGMLQLTAFLLNMLPVPPFDGFGIIEPYLPFEMRYKMRRAGNIPLFVVIFLFWYVEPVYNSFWNVVYGILGFLGIPPELAWQGFVNFQFWRNN